MRFTIWRFVASLLLFSTLSTCAILEIDLQQPQEPQTDLLETTAEPYESPEPSYDPEPGLIIDWRKPSSSSKEDDQNRTEQPDLLLEIDAPLLVTPPPDDITDADDAESEREPQRGAEPTPEVTYVPAPGAVSNTYAFKLRLLHARPSVEGDVDLAVRRASANFTSTAAADWTLIDSAPLVTLTPTPSAAAAGAGVPGPTTLSGSAGPATPAKPRNQPSAAAALPLRSWVAEYHAVLPAEAAVAYARYVSSGGLASDIVQTGEVGFVQASLLAAPELVEDAPAPGAKIGPDPGASADSGGGNVEGTESNTQGGNSVPVLWIVLGACLLGVILVAILAFYVLYSRRRSGPDTMAPPGGSRATSLSSGLEHRMTSLGGSPSGADALRAHAGIRSWQEGAASAFPPASPPPPPPPVHMLPASGVHPDHGDAFLPLPPPPPLGSSGAGDSTFVRQTPPAAYEPKVEHNSSGTSSSAYAPETGTSATPRTSSAHNSVSTAVVSEDRRSSAASTAYALGVDSAHALGLDAPGASRDTSRGRSGGTSGGIVLDDGRPPAPHSFVTFGQHFGSPER